MFQPTTLRSVAFLLLPVLSLSSPLHVRQDPSSITVTQTVTSSPAAPTGNWAAGSTSSYPIHHTCNTTLRAQLTVALNETVQLAAHAKDHLLRWGNESPFVQKYFGNGSTAGPIGWFERVVAADRSGMTFRCDDPDRNCETQAGWAGHWRGSNATQETVICPLSFAIRRNLPSVCGLGYTVSESPLNTYWATDLLHRIFHVPKISEEQVAHYAEDFADVLELAKTAPAKSALDSDTLQYFAIDVWAFDIAAPGIGCSGKTPEPATVTEPAATETATSTPTQSAAPACHTHSDGVVHCD